jgi:hypothetical protein
MQKKLIPALCIILLSLPFSCSELILPKNLDIHGTMDISIKVLADNWGNSVVKVLRKIFSGNSGEDDTIDYETEVYDVNYNQTEQTFLISIHSEITNYLNPSEYFKETGEFLYQRDSSELFNISHEIDLGDLKKQELSVSKIVSVPSIPDGSLSPPISYPFSENMPLGIDGFLHASIAKGDMEIIIEPLDGSTVLNNSRVDVTYSNISISQNRIFYDGLSYSGPSNRISLDGQDINNETIKIDGTVNIKSKSGGDIALISGALKLNITIIMNIQKLNEVDWDFLSIKDILNGHQIDPVSLENVAQNVNYILYDEKNIGLTFEFEDIIDGLEMSVESDALRIEQEFQYLVKDEALKFANKNAGMLWLNDAYSPVSGYPPFTTNTVPTESLDFELVLQPKNGGNVLHIKPDEGINTDKPLKINGKAEFFQNWTKAQINLDKIIKAAPNSTGVYTRSIPSEGNDPIDLSVLKDYISGFSYEDIRAEMHINGPNEAVNNADVEEDPILYFYAEHWKEDPIMSDIVPIYERGPLVLEQTRVSLNNSDFDARGSYKKRALPPNGKPFDFARIMNSESKHLIFNYELSLPDTLTVTHDAFLNGDTVMDSKITVTIYIMIPMKLRVMGDGPGIIRFPDMFGDMEDLFGRSDVNGDSIFNSLDMDYLRFSIDFTGSFFSGGKLFIEKTGKERLFRNGIGLNGTKIVLNISGADFETIKNNLISPDFRLIFESPNSAINVPRNIGLSNIKFETRGKLEL